LLDLKERLGATMGDPRECEHTNRLSGDATQFTTTGFAYVRAGSLVPAFTDGWRHWALTSGDLVTWEGDSIDPPAGSGQ
jgi:hypothetical protein